METESNILRSPALIRQTIGTLRDQGEYSPSPGILNKWVSEPLKRYVTTPLREYIVNPLRDGLGLEVDPVRDTTLDMLTDEAIANLKIETLPGSNAIPIIYTFGAPTQGTRFVAQWLDTYPYIASGCGRERG